MFLIFFNRKASIFQILIQMNMVCEREPQCSAHFSLLFRTKPTGAKHSTSLRQIHVKQYPWGPAYPEINTNL